MHSPSPTLLSDYRPSHFLIDTALLHIDLYETHARIKSTLTIRRNPAVSSDAAAPLVLDGEALTLHSILLDAHPLDASQYTCTDTQLVIHTVPDAFTLEITIENKPHENLRLSGLYKTGANFCTQCESHGFRRITYFLDRPDVLARFTTVISAEKARYPILLSNGNRTDQGEGEEGRHWVRWEDPTLKPCYLFALVAGDLDHLEDRFTTQSGRSVQLCAYVEKGKRAQVLFAMEALKESMQWDEKKYGREYDLDIFMIVGVSDFNFGAMENKGLNIFNDRYILAQSETATDEDFIAIKNVVAHEYFHNWSGNRVTVRDWFQITLKEGLTVFRDQQFTADKTSLVAKRIQEAKSIRNLQFVQDAGPMAHPIYPDSYIEINNFYTVTVYEKGAEVIRMIHTLLGEAAFRQAMDLYFSRHDGHPATASDFVRAMQDSSGVDLTQFWRWYKQAGTPTLTIADSYDAETKIYTLHVTQSCPPTADHSEKNPFHIPLRMGLLDKSGQELVLRLKGEEASSTTKVVSIQNVTETFHFVDIPDKPLPSLLRNFSAPVKLHYPYQETDYVFLLAHDTDLFNRWDAAQQLATRILLGCVSALQAKKTCIVPTDFLAALKKALEDTTLDKAVVAEMLTLPSETYLLEQLLITEVYPMDLKELGIDAVHAAREWLRKEIAIALKEPLFQYYTRHASVTPHQLDHLSIAQRKLKNVALSYLALLDDPAIPAACLSQFQQANNMTDTLGALLALNHIDCPERTKILADFYSRWEQDALVIYKWFSCQALSYLPNTLEVVKSLTQHPAFQLHNPNSVRALIHAFCSGNLVHFHARTGEGYVFLTDYVLKIDSFNPSLAARLVEPLIHWKKYDAERQALMQAQLKRILDTKPLSNDVYEMVSRSVAP
jgi:aminopeptidase N